MSVVPFPPMKRPLIAILRGLKPEEAEGVVSVLIETGITAIEIPLNSPDPFRSIEIAVKMAPAEVLIGAGTVLTPPERRPGSHCQSPATRPGHNARRLYANGGVACG